MSNLNFIENVFKNKSNKHGFNVFDKKYVNELLKEIDKKLQKNSLSDKEQYILSYKMNSLKEIN